MFDQHETHRYDDGPELSAELAALQRQLAGLSPAAPRVDRDQLMFAAGQAAASQDGPAIQLARRSWAGSRFWPIATATMTAATVLLSTMLMRQAAKSSGDVPAGGPLGVVEVAPPQSNSPAAVQVAEVTNWTPPLWTLDRPTSGYLAMRYVALTQGVAALDTVSESADRGSPSQGTSQRPPATVRELLHELLPEASKPAGIRS